MATFQPKSTSPDNVTDRGKVERVRTSGSGDSTETTEWIDVATQAELDAHTGDTTDAHAGTAITFTPTGTVAATTVQAAIAEVASEYATADSTHAALTATHGVAGAIVGTTDSQTLTNKTVTQPTLTLKQSTTPTPTAEGDIQWDTDDNKIKVGDGATTKTFSDDSVNAATYQPLDADLTSIAAAASAANKMLYATGAQTWTVTDLSAAARTVLDDASVAAMRVTLGDDVYTSVNNADYTIVATDKVVAQTGTLSAARTFTLPAANAVNAGQVIVVIDASGTVTSTNTITVQRAGSDTINGSTSTTITSLYGWRTLVSDGSSKWSQDSSLLRMGLATAKGDLLAATAANAITRLAVGSDGHVLTADSAQATGVKWAAAGSGAVASDTIWDAKGDIAVATAADTAAKLTVGSNGQVPTADSNATSGLRYIDWALTPATSTFYLPYGQSTSTTAIGSAQNQVAIWYPFFIPNRRTLTAISVNVTTLEAGSTTKLGVYNLTMGAPISVGSLVADYGDADTSGTGLKQATGSTALNPGWYFICGWCSNHTTVRLARSSITQPPMGLGTITSTSFDIGFVRTGVDFSAGLGTGAGATVANSGTQRIMIAMTFT
jgi:hypothetical protein